MKSRYDKLCDRWIVLYLWLMVAIAMAHTMGGLSPQAVLAAWLLLPVGYAAAYMAFFMGAWILGYVAIACFNGLCWVSGKDEHMVEI